MEEIEKRISECRKLAQHQFRRVSGTLARSLQGQIAQPYRECFAAPFGSGFDLAKLLRSDPCGDGLVRKPGFSCALSGAPGIAGIGLRGVSIEARLVFQHAPDGDLGQEVVSRR